MKVIFAKYNRNRLPQFQTVTKMIEDVDGTRYILKEPLCDEANKHIATLYDNYFLLKNNYHINLVKPERNQNKLTFSMATGVSLEQVISKAVLAQDKIKFEHNINLFMAYVESFVSNKNIKFQACEDFISVFGEWSDDEPQDIVQIANVDLIFGNLFISDDKIQLIDYEWVFDFPIPKSYILWRAFNQFSSFYLDAPVFAEFKNLLNDKINNKNFLEIEAKLHAYVHGKNEMFSLPLKILKSTNFIEIDSSQKLNPHRLSIQLFASYANIFSEKHIHSFSIDNIPNVQKFVFALLETYDIEALRVAFSNDYCVVKILKLSLVQDNGLELDLKSFMHTNALYENNDILYFDTMYSQIVFNGVSVSQLQKSKYVLAEVQYVGHGKEALRMCLQNYKKEQNKFIAKLCSKRIDSKLVFFGASSALEKKFDSLKTLEIVPDYICDNASNKHGTFVHSYEVQSPEKLLQTAENFLVFITSSYVGEIKSQLKRYKNVSVIGDISNIE